MKYYSAHVSGSPSAGMNRPSNTIVRGGGGKFVAGGWHRMLLIGLLLAVIMLAAPVMAATITVAADGTGDYTDIQSAIIAASSGDTIFIKAGTYAPESLILINKPDLTLQGAGTDKVTIQIGGEGMLAVGLDLEGAPTDASRTHIEGITFQSSTIYVMDGSSNIQIANNKFLDPTFDEGGIYLISGSNIVRNNIISGATGGSGGIGVSGASNTIDSNTIQLGAASGLSLYSGNNVVTNNSFLNNTGASVRFFNAGENNQVFLNNFNGNSVPVTTDGSTAPSTISWVSPSMVSYTYNNAVYSAVAGNYWGSTYLGNDADGNGIGDASFTVPSSLGTDTAPLMGTWNNGVIAYSTSAGIAPVAGFYADSTHGGAPLTVQFTDTSINTPTAWQWDFNNDGVVDSTAQNPVYTYTTPATYTVKLTAGNADGSDDEIKSGYILVGNTLTIAADGTGDYTTISAGVAAASAGDTVHIKSGSYTQSSSITITQPDIAIQGESSDKVTIVTSQGYGIDFSSTGGIFENIKYQGSATIILTGNSNVVRNNIFLEGSAIHIGSSYNLIENNVIIKPTTYGFYSASNFSIIRNNVIIGATQKYCARIDGSSNRIENNTIKGGTSTSSSGGALSLISGSSNNTILNNYILDNAVYGFRLNTAGNDNKIYQNTIIGNSRGTVSGTSPPTSIYWVSPESISYSYKEIPQSGIVGNYWGNAYSGADADNNGIGNTYYTLPSSFGTDTAPLVGIWQEGVIHGGPDTIAPGAGFTPSAISGQAPLAVTFTSWTPGPGTVSSYSWDFGDGSTSTDANPSHTYTTPGTYTVNLTVTGPGGSTSMVKTDLITVRSASLPDLTVISITGPVHHSASMLTATIKNIGEGDAGAFKVNFTIDGNTTVIDILSLSGGSTTIINATDPVTTRKYGDTVPLTVTVDTENSVAESNETNNVYNTTATVSASGSYYYGGRFYTGNDLETRNFTEGHITMFSSEGNSSYRTGGGWYTTAVEWTSSDLPVPTGSTIESARLYQSYTWDDYGNPGFTLQFNGNAVDQAGFYGDGTNNYNGQAVYDVTPYFSIARNMAIINATKPDGGIYSTVLVVIYQDSSAPYRKIWLNEGCDSLYNPDHITTDPYIAYATFGNVTTTGMSFAKIINFLPSGNDNDQKSILFNSQNPALTGSGGGDPIFDYYDVTGALQNGTNEMGVKFDDSYINLAVSILELTCEAPPSGVSFSASVTSGEAPVAVQFTDHSYGATSWQWDFNNDGTIDSTEKNPVHTYTNAGTYTVNLTATNAYGSTSMVKTGYITVTGGSGGNTGPIVSFSADTTSGTFPLTVRFTDTSTGDVTAWAWDFTNDGVVDSTAQNPAYNYTNAGTYSVNLTATNAEGTNSTVKSGYITVSIVSAASLPLTTEKNGTVSGDLYVGSFQPVPFASQPTSGVTSRDFDQLFTLPNFTNIQWAKVYVNVYSMSGSRDIPSRTTTSLDGNSDGTYETVLGVEEMTSGSSYSTDGKVYWINDHTNRVYSDYETSYDVTNLITSSHPAVHVKNEKTGTEYDGRLKAVTLVVAYNDGDSDTVKYWVNHGHDWFNTGSSSTTFGTAGIPTGFTDATLNNVALSSADSTYTFNGVSQAGANPVAPINYYENHTWSVTGAVNPAADSVFQYALGTGSSFKTTLAALAVRYPGSAPAPVASFTATPTSGGAPLTVNFTDTSTGSPTVWNWSFGDGAQSNVTNPVHTYTTAGNYSVSLTVTNSNGMNSTTRSDFITVTSPGADLIVSAGPVSSSSPSPNLLAHYTANIIKATVRNQGTQSAGSFNVTFNVNGNLTPVNVAGLGAGSSTVVNTTDTVDRSVGAFVPVIVIADAEVAVAESNKTNNQYFYNATVIRNGYAGMRWGDGPDITTTKVTTLHGDIVYSLGNSAYGSGSAAWTAGDLPIPAGATVKDARLYITYCWDSGNVMPGAAVTSFNGVAKSYESFYSDKKNWGGYAYPFGVIIYNVTDQFNTSGNSVSATGIPPIRGMELVVTYEDPTATEKQIFVNEGFDLLYASPSYYTTEETATAYAPFTGASIALGNVNQATLTTFINRGGSGITRGTMFFNGEEYPNYWTIAGPEIGVNTTDVTAYLKETGNTVAFRSLVANNMDMEPHLAILKVERKGGSTATLSATSVSGIGRNQNGTIGIYLNNSFSPKAGSLTVQLYYNESILSAQAVEIMADGVAPINLSSPITLAIATAAGIPNGNAWLANVTFRSEQDTAMTSDLGLELTTLEDLSIPPQDLRGMTRIQNGTFTTGEGIQVQVVGADGNPVIADRIALEGGAGPFSVTSQSSHRFSVVPAGTYQLIVTKAGHIGVNTTISYAAGSVRELTATMVTHAYQPTVILAENG
ncbi:MAG: DUF3344 domain-containing protein, partial [Methanoregula sp.]